MLVAWVVLGMSSAQAGWVQTRLPALNGDVLVVERKGRMRARIQVLSPQGAERYKCTFQDPGEVMNVSRDLRNGADQHGSGVQNGVISVANDKRIAFTDRMSKVQGGAVALMLNPCFGGVSVRTEGVIVEFQRTYDHLPMEVPLDPDTARKAGEALSVSR